MSRTQIYIIAGLAVVVVFICAIGLTLAWVQFITPATTFTIETRGPESSGEIDPTTIISTLFPTPTHSPTLTATRVVPDTATPQPATPTPALAQPAAQPTPAPRKCRVGSGTMWVEVDCTPAP